MRISGQDAATVATGFASGDDPLPELASQAVRAALARIDAPLAGSVLLLLTSHFQRHAQAAVAAAGRAGHCVQVAGGTAPGVFTESQWSLETPAAAALVMTGDIGLVRPLPHEPVLTLTAGTVPPHWQADGDLPRFGMLGAGGEGEGRAWVNGKICADGCCEIGFGNARVAIGVSRGLNALTPLMTVDEADGHEIFGIDGETALAALANHLPDVPHLPHLPMPPLFAARIDAGLTQEEAIGRGSYRLLPILAVNPDEGSLTLAASVFPGEQLFWAQVQPGAAIRDSRAGIARIATQMPDPAFALLFACIGRGPYFFGGEDRDVAALRERFPGLPMLGGYGTGEIAPLAGGNALISYSAVTALVGHVQT